MASELIVQTLKGPTSGSNANKVIIPSGQTLDIDAWSPPAGTVLQVASGRASDNRYSTTSTSFVGLGSTVSITPSSTSSRIAIFAAISIQEQSGSTFFLDFRRGSTQNISGKTGGIFTVSGTETLWSNATYHFVDSPNTTSSIAYGLSLRCSSGTLFLNDNSANNETSLILMEIAG